jgi:peptidoglycan/xylan/chitin deacetylase (PgdA/CDA1 family)
MWRLPLSIAAPGGSRGRLSILILHRVLAAPDPLLPDLPTVAEFEQRMRWVRSWFRVLPLERAIELLFRGELPARALAITFDDGYADNEELAAPALARLGLSATFFVCTGFLDGGSMWNDRVIAAVRACPADEIDLASIGLGRHRLASPQARRAAVGAILTAIKHLPAAERERATAAIVSAAGGVPAPPAMMRAEQVRSLRRLGMAIGAHTVTHPILTRIAAEVARDEMERSKRDLEAILQERVGLFAYPNGVPGQDFAREHAAMAKACGFDAAVSTAWGAASRRSDRFQLPRFSPWDRTRLRYGARLLANVVRPAETVV